MTRDGYSLTNTHPLIELPLGAPVRDRSEPRSRPHLRGSASEFVSARWAPPNTREPDPWIDQARCATEKADPEMFFDAYRRNEAVRFCGGCPVKTECLKDHWDDPHAVAGGKTPSQRSQLGGAKGWYLPTNAHAPASLLGISPEDIILAYKRGGGMSQVAEQFGITRATVRRTLAGAGVPIRGEKGTKLSQEQVDEIIRLYEEGYGYRRIKNRTGVPAPTVRRTLELSGAMDRQIESMPCEIKQQQAELRERALGMLLDGVKPMDVARNLGRHKAWVYDIMRKNGIETDFAKLMRAHADDCARGDHTYRGMALECTYCKEERE